MKILCTGGAGYLGSILVPELLADGHDVTVFDNFMWKQAPFNHLCHKSNLEIVKGDVRNSVKPYLETVDVIIPLAALVGAPLCDMDQQTAMNVNYHAIADIVNHVRPEQKIIIPISNSGYGVGELGKECTEDTPMRPISLYGRTKVLAEKKAFEHGNTVSLRLATVFGMSPRMRLDLLVNDFVYRAVTDKAVVLFEPHFKRNYISVRDVANAFRFAIRNFDKMKGLAFNVGLSDANLSKLELCRKIQNHLPKFVFLESPIGEDPDKRDYIVSNARIEALGFRTEYSLDAGISELIRGYTYLRNSQYGNV